MSDVVMIDSCTFSTKELSWLSWISWLIGTSEFSSPCALIFSWRGVWIGSDTISGAILSKKKMFHNTCIKKYKVHIKLHHKLLSYYMHHACICILSKGKKLKVVASMPSW